MAKQKDIITFTRFFKEYYLMTGSKDSALLLEWLRHYSESKSKAPIEVVASKIEEALAITPRSQSEHFRNLERLGYINRTRIPGRRRITVNHEKIAVDFKRINEEQNSKAAGKAEKRKLYFQRLIGFIQNGEYEEAKNARERLSLAALDIIYSFSRQYRRHRKEQYNLIPDEFYQCVSWIKSLKEEVNAESMLAYFMSTERPTLIGYLTFVRNITKRTAHVEMHSEDDISSIRSLVG